MKIDKYYFYFNNNSQTGSVIYTNPRIKTYIDLYYQNEKVRTFIKDTEWRFLNYAIQNEYGAIQICLVPKQDTLLGRADTFGELNYRLAIIETYKYLSSSLWAREDTRFTAALISSSSNKQYNINDEIFINLEKELTSKTNRPIVGIESDIDKLKEKRNELLRN